MLVVEVVVAEPVPACVFYVARPLLPSTSAYASGRASVVAVEVVVAVGEPVLVKVEPVVVGVVEVSAQEVAVAVVAVPMGGDCWMPAYDRLPIA